MIGFAALHPLVTAIYFVSVLLFSMFGAHPALHLLALLGGAAFCLKLEWGTRAVSGMLYYLPLVFAVALTNPLFSHNGTTVLFFLSGNPVTLEAVLYGVDLGLALLGVLLWFRCINRIFTSDKLEFLLGRLSPKLALLISTALRFIPLLKMRGEALRKTQTALGLFATDTWSDKLKMSARMYSALITRALEDAIDTGASMKARGYGLKGWSHFALYRFGRADAGVLCLVLALDAGLLAVTAMGGLQFSFYPSISTAPMKAYTCFALALYALLCLLPFILQVKEGLQWKYSISKI